MLRGIGTSLGTWTMAAIVVAGLLVGLGPALAAPATGVAAPAGGAPWAAAPAAPTVSAPSAAMPMTVAAAPAPAANASNGTSPNVTASVTITSTYAGLTTVPAMVTWSINVTGATIDANNVSMALVVMNGANELANMSESAMPGVMNYSDMVDYGVLNSENFGGGTLPTTPYTFMVWVTAMNASNASVAPMTNVSAPVSATLAIANVQVLFTSTLPLYDAVPFPIAFTTTISGNTGTVLNTLNVSVYLELRFIQSGCGSQFGYGAPCQTVANESLTDLGVFEASGVYSYNVTTADFGAQAFGNGQYPLGEYQVIIWTTLSNVSNPAQEARTGAGAQYLYPVFDTNAATFLSPSPTAPSMTGNVSVAVAYTADYLSSANVTVYANTTDTVVYYVGVFSAGLAAHSGGGTWAAAIPGMYRAVLAIGTAAGAASGTSTFTMFFNLTAPPSATSQTVYYNQTIWKNTTNTTPVVQHLVGGLSPGVAAAILLVVGLVVGMVVAMVLGQMMWGGAKPAPAQPWQAKPANECSVCHQTFPSEAELKEHAKQAHGVE